MYGNGSVFPVDATEDETGQVVDTFDFASKLEVQVQMWPLFRSTAVTYFSNPKIKNTSEHFVCTSCHVSEKQEHTGQVVLQSCIASWCHTCPAAILSLLDVGSFAPVFCLLLSKELQDFENGRAAFITERYISSNPKTLKETKRGYRSKEEKRGRSVI